MGFFSSPPSQTPITTSKLCTPRSQFTVVIILLLSLTAADGISYSDHCNDVVQESPLLPNPNPLITDTWFLALRHTHISCAPNRTNKGICVIPYSLSFWIQKAYKTQKIDVLQIESMLELLGLGDRVQFSLIGLWDSDSGKICMVGPGLGKFSSNHVVLKLDYLNSSTMFSSFVNGTLEGLDSDNKTNLDLKPLSILGVNMENYKYELIDKVSESNDFQLLDDMSSDSLRVRDLKKATVCMFIRAARYFELEYKGDCNGVNCDFLGNGYKPSMMYTNEVKCLEDGRVRFLLNFGDNRENEYHLPFKPNTDLISEGKWDAKQRRLNMVGCRISSDWDEGFVRECFFRLSLRFPAKMNLTERSIIVGEFWSSSSVNETGYFGRVVLSSKINNEIRAPSLSYDYTELDKAKRYCANKIFQEGERKSFPRPLSPHMSFQVVARSKKVMGLSGSAYPLFVGSQQYTFPNKLGWQQQKFSYLLNVSYALSLGTSHDFELSSKHKKIQSFDISAEGTYDSESGYVCMIGCMRVGQNISLDCEIVVDIQYHPVFEADENSLFLQYIERNDGEVVKGTIKSTREKSDGLFFEPFEIASRWI